MMKTLPIGTTGIAARDINSIADHIPKGTRITIVGVSGFGYEVKSDTCFPIHDAGWDCITPDPEFIPDDHE